MRMIIEVEASALAAERHNKQDERKLFDVLNRFKNSMLDKESVGSEADYEFHLTLIKASKNPFLEQTFMNIRTVLENSLQFSLSKNIGKPRKRKEVYHEHLKIYEAFCARDIEATKKYMKEHLTNVKIKLETRYK
ncbi:FadR/GntR family transcriptional regulator [Virgibacillus alimentarius]|nr:FCD domain-containing protein [Virgibacillus alimentarius]